MAAADPALFCAPHPSLPGGVNAAVGSLLPALPEARRVTVGRQPGRPGLHLADPLRVARMRGSALVLNPSLRRRALVRDLAILGAWRGPAALWIHGGSVRAWKALTRSVGRRWLRRVADRALLVVLADRFGARLIHAGVPADRVRVVPPPWDPFAIPQILGPGRTVLFLGRLVPQKGPQMLLEAFSRIADRHPEIQLVLAGTGPMERELADWAGRLGLRGRVQLPGQLDRTAKRAALSQAAVLVLPSLDEAVPLAVLEGMASGLVVVASDVGAVAETVGDAGYLVPPRDVGALASTLDRVLTLPIRDSERARRRAQATHPDRVAARWRRILAELA